MSNIDREQFALNFHRNNLGLKDDATWAEIHKAYSATPGAFEEANDKINRSLASLTGVTFETEMNERGLLESRMRRVER